MRHRRSSNTLGRRTGQRIAMLKGLSKNLLIHQRIKTTLARAKALRVEVEKLITLAKKDTLHHRRLVDSFLQDHQLTSELFKEIAPLFKTRNGGYTRIMRLNHRAGDNAQMVLIELVEQKIKKAAPAKPKAEPKPKAEKVEKPKEEIKPKAEVKPEIEKLKEEHKEKPKEEKPKGFLAGFKKIFKTRPRSQ